MTPLLRFISSLIPERDFEGRALRKILIVDCNYLGDLLMDSCAWQIVYEHLGVKADALTWPEAVPALEGNPWVDRVYTTDHDTFSVIRAGYELGRENYDLVIHLNTSLAVNAGVFLAGPYRLGYDYKGRGCLLNWRIPLDRRTYFGKYRPEEVADLFRLSFGWPCNLPRMTYTPRTYPGPPEIPLAVFAPCTRSTRGLRMWSKWGELGRRVYAEYGLAIILAGLPEDEEYLAGIGREMGERIPWMISRYSFDELAYTLKCVSLCVTVNTATMHLAISQNTPTVAVIGGTPASVVFPEGNPRFQCVEDLGLGFGIYHPRISEITVEEVMEKVRSVWSSAT